MGIRIFQNPDLHMHSTFSDGTDTPEALIAKVKAAGIDCFALTDHDSFGGCAEIKRLLQPGDPYFIGGIELSCEDELGKYHILGYCYNPDKPSIRTAVQQTHETRRIKAANRFRHLAEVHGLAFTREEQDAVLALNNPGKPHIAKLMIQKGYVSDMAEAFDLMADYQGNDFILSPAAAIDAILSADGIPVLAHGILGAGSINLPAEQIELRVNRLKAAGLMGLECYYSAYAPEQTEIMLSLAEKYNLFITAGSDYHGNSKSVKLGETGRPDPKKLNRFYQAVAHLLEEKSSK